MRASELQKTLGGFTGGMLIGQCKFFRIPGNPPVVNGNYFGLPAGSITLINRALEHNVTSRPFLEYLFGEGTEQTIHTVPAIALGEIPYLRNIDPREGLYLRIR